MLEDIVKKHSYSSMVLGQHKSFVHALLDVKIACARANGKSETISGDAAAKIEKACGRLRQEVTEKLLPVDIYQGGGGIAVHLNINEAIGFLDQEISLGDISVSQSTADVCATALRILLQREWLVFEKTLLLSQDLFVDRAKEFSEIDTLSRTCLQDALPTKLGFKFSSYGKNLARRMEGLRGSMKALRQVSLGGTVIGTGDGASPSYRQTVVGDLSDVTGLPLSQREDLVDAAQNIDDIAALSHELSLLAESLVKMAKDLRLLHSGPDGGFAEIILPQAMQGSSFFGSKNNPTVVESLLQSCFHVLGMQRSVSACQEHGELDLNTFELMAGLLTHQSMNFLNNALNKFNHYALKDVIANKERCAQLSTKARGHKNGNASSKT